MLFRLFSRCAALAFWVMAVQSSLVASLSVELVPDGSTCCPIGEQHSPEACWDDKDRLAHDQSMTACCIDKDKHYVHYASKDDKPIEMPLNMAGKKEIDQGGHHIALSYNITGISLHQSFAYLNLTVSAEMPPLTFGPDTRTLDVQFSKGLSNAGFFLFETPFGTVIVNLQTQINEDGSVHLVGTVLGTGFLQNLEEHFQNTIQEAKVILRGYTLCPHPALKECFWAGTAPVCDGECPKDGGWTAVQQSPNGDGQKCNIGVKTQCCRPKQYLGQCEWFGTAPLCKGECPSGWIENHEDACGDGNCCATGRKKLCCPAHPDPREKCAWFGTSPFCDGECPSGWTQKGDPDDCGDGKCCTTGHKVRCCHRV